MSGADRELRGQPQSETSQGTTAQTCRPPDRTRRTGQGVARGLPPLPGPHGLIPSGGLPGAQIPGRSPHLPGAQRPHGAQAQGHAAGVRRELAHRVQSGRAVGGRLAASLAEASRSWEGRHRQEVREVGAQGGVLIEACPGLYARPAGRRGLRQNGARFKRVDVWPFADVGEGYTGGDKEYRDCRQRWKLQSLKARPHTEAPMISTFLDR